ncbi:MAG: homogentisate 1,2-dioxygenase [Saprospiraceae bacterium]|nr:homogentisate 1,2-dioxygenase [Saprospiraceae bacterium]
MPVYQQHGKIPHKRHVQFRRPTGELYHEELVGTQGFSGSSTLVYHLYPPTIVTKKEKPYSVMPEIGIEKNLSALSFQGFQLPQEDQYMESRTVIFMNNDLRVGLAAPRYSMTDYFFKNADADEMIFIHEGSGLVKTMYGEVPFCYGDYVIIPRGTIYQIEFDTEDNRLLILESSSPIRTPRRYRNETGQLLEHSPFCERDIKLPKNMETHDEHGEFKVFIKKQDMIYPYTYATHPFDIVGWDGYHYPYAISILDFEPLTGRIHMPPPIHQQFEGDGFVVCSFVPRLYDYHPDAIPAPYHHSNIDADEILYYVDGDFMSRNDIRKGQLTLHPGGIPHGPHPGAIERSIGKKGTNELAVMIDPFRPVMITKAAMQLEVEDYYRSWAGYAKEVEAN